MADNRCRINRLTELWRTEKAMPRPEADYRSLLEQIPAVPYIDLPNDEQTAVYVGPQIESILGIDRDEYMSDPTTWDRHIHPEDRPYATHEYADAIAQARPFDFEYRMVRGDGRVIWIRDQGFVLQDQSGRSLLVQGILNDVTDRREAQDRVARSAEYLAVLHGTAVDAIRRLDWPDLLQTIVERAARLAATPNGYAYVRGPDETLEVTAGTGLFMDWIGYRLRVGDGLAGRVVATGQAMLLDDYDSWAGRSATWPKGLLGSVVGVPLRSGERITGAIGLAQPPGGPAFSEEAVAILTKFGEIASLALDNARLYAAAQEELRQRQRAEETLQFLAFHDALTGLPNRMMFEEVLEVALARARRGKLAVAVLYMDLDNFKLVNDSLGHAAGDALLREASARLRNAVRDTDFVARQGGDEFLILLADLPSDETQSDSSGTVEAVTARIEASLRQPVATLGTEVYTSASIGISAFPLHAEDGPTLLRYADAAMYASKRLGPGHHHLFDPVMADSATKLSFTTRLRKAVEQSEWVLHYQPIVDLAEASVIGVEALVRWKQPDGSLILPGQFIPLVEEMGLIGPLGDWVVAEVCRQAGQWRDRGLSIFTTFNVSLGQLWQPELSSKVLEQVRVNRLEPSRVIVEITESSAMTDPVRTERILTELKDAGLRLAIDDFGTGHSSLSRLKHMPADILKIDRPFLAEVPADPAARSMVKAIVGVAEGLSMQPLAEGVETDRQRAFLLESGCRMGQGYLFSEAVPGHRIEALAGSSLSTPSRASRARRTG
jgi:diguanylate cyclase (GGDEF)-like protein/PAS domain S-box-containing protein